MDMNYNKETIPALEEIRKGVQRILQDLPTSPKLQFSDFFCSRNKEWWRNEKSIAAVDGTKKENLLLEKEKFTGIYLLSTETAHQYVGISGDVVSRIKQHFTGKQHTTASLAFLQATQQATIDRKLQNNYSRCDVPFEDYRENIQSKMREQWSIQILPEDNYYILTCAEVYIAAEFHCYWNSFATH